MSHSRRQPSYRYHKARNCAVVTIDGRNRYLGPFDSPESHQEYARLIAEWLSALRFTTTFWTFLREFSPLEPRCLRPASSEADSPCNRVASVSFLLGWNARSALPPPFSLRKTASAYSESSARLTGRAAPADRIGDTFCCGWPPCGPDARPSGPS